MMFFLSRTPAVQLLICKLEKNKTMKAGDKAVIMTTLGTLTKSITKLQQEIKGLSNPSGGRGAPKSKAQVYIHTHTHNTSIFMTHDCQVERGFWL
jgi:hypothetical protein